MERLGDAGLLSKDKLLADGFPTDATAVERDDEHVERLIPIGRLLQRQR